MAEQPKATLLTKLIYQSNIYVSQCSDSTADCGTLLPPVCVEVLDDVTRCSVLNLLVVTPQESSSSSDSPETDSGPVSPPASRPSSRVHCGK